MKDQRETFSEMAEELQRLRSDVERLEQNHTAYQIALKNNCEAEQAAIAEAEKLKADVERLQADALTPEEAAALLDVLYTLNPHIVGLEQSIDAKLRRIANDKEKGR